MDIGSLLLGLALGLLILLVVVQPLADRSGVREKKTSETDVLIAEREQLLTALRDLDFDHATGKITDDDYVPQRAQLMAQGAAVLKQLDEMRPLAAPGADTSEAATEWSMDDFIESEIAARRQTSPANAPNPAAEITAGACPHCGVATRAGDRFCPKCGTTLSIVCRDCGHTLQPNDRFCPRCGVRQAETQPNY